MTPIPAIIPARGGSKGIPRKNVRLLAGKPLIVHNIEAALGAAGVSSVWVSTDDDEIAAVSEAAGARVIRRPADLASDTASSESALLHALDQIERAGALADAFFFLQCTSPLTRAEDLDGAFAHFQETGADSLLSVVPNHRFLWKAAPAGSGYVGINHDQAVRLRRQDLPPEFAENGAFYLMRTAGFRERRHRFFGRTEVYPMPAESAVEIDDPSDFTLIELLLRQREQPAASLRLTDLGAIVFDFDGVFTDDRVWVDENGKESAVCSRSDGMGIELLRKAFDGPILILSREQNPIVRHRAKKLKLECLHGVGDKLGVLREWADRQGIALERIAFVGNDVNDLACLQAVGLSVVPKDAHPQVRLYARLTLSRCGGRGAVREFCDLLLSQKR